MTEIKLTRHNFQNEVINSDKPVLVDFGADWCGPCRMLAPVVSELAKDTNGRYKVGKVNVDKEQKLAELFQIMSIPTLLLFKNGKPAHTAVVYKPKEALLKMLNREVKK